MAKTELEPILSEMHGAVSKHGAVMRRKRLRDSRGRVLKTCKQETYFVGKPRNFKRHPQEGDELKNRNLFAQAIYQAREILSAAKPENNPTEDQLAELEQWRQRFDAQVPNVRGNKPDPEAPIDRVTRKAKRYVQLPAFIRAIIYQQLKRADQG